MSARPWIGTRREDLVFFFGSPVAAVLLGLLLMAAPWLLVPLWWLWLLLGDGPHLAATWTRTYGDPEVRQRLPRLLAWSPALYLLGPALWLLGRAFGSPAPFQLFLGFAVLWAWHHAVRQHYGLVALYGRLDRLPASDLAADRRFLHAFLWLLFGLFLLAFPANRAVLGLARPEGYAGPKRLVAAALGLLTAAYAGILLWRWRQGRSVRSGLFALLFIGGLATFAFLVMGAKEPLLDPPRTPEQAFFATSLLGGVVHTVQYLGLVAIANRRRGRRREGTARPFAFGAPGRTYAFLVLAAFGYLALNSLRGDVPGLSFLRLDQPAGQLMLALYWGLFFHHYYLDQWIWHPSRDPELRADLGLEAA